MNADSGTPLEDPLGGLEDASERAASSFAIRKRRRALVAYAPLPARSDASVQ